MLPVLCYPILDLAYQMLVLLPNSKIQRFAFLTGAFRETLRRVGENLLDHRNLDDLYPVLSVSYTSFWTIITHANSLRIKSPLKTIQDVHLKHLKRLHKIWVRLVRGYETSGKPLEVLFRGSAVKPPVRVLVGLSST